MCLISSDYDGPTFYNTTFPKAKKEHKCVECRRIINPGEEYERVEGLWEGEFSTFKTCNHCTYVREWLIINCGGLLYSCVYEDLREHCYAYPELWRAVVGMRRKWKRFKDDKLMPLIKIKGIDYAKRGFK